MAYSIMNDPNWRPADPNWQDYATQLEQWKTPPKVWEDPVLGGPGNVLNFIKDV